MRVDRSSPPLMAKHFLLFVFLALTSLAHAQEQSGFINIDCGIADGDIYTDEITGLDYVSDADYIDTGVSKTISPTYKTNGLEQQFSNVRSFPEGIKNCYTLTPPRRINRTRYFVRARFMYGNYDNKNQVPKFHLYLGVNKWATVELRDASTPETIEIIHEPSANYTYVCLVNIGSGTPFISVLDLRLVNDGIYKAYSGESLALYGRYDLRSFTNRASSRYKDDIFDRIWEPSFFSNERVSELSTPVTIGEYYQNRYKLPSAVMTTAVTPQNASKPLEFYWEPPDLLPIRYYIYMHFADFQSNQSREFNITFNDIPWFTLLTPYYLDTRTIRSYEPETPAARVNFSFIKTENSTLPPIINAIELYTVKEFLDLQTDQEDVDAIKEIRATYGVKKNWQGDPCIPQALSWEGLKCLNVIYEPPPRITSLNLSFSGLTGKISPFLLNLKKLQYLDLSNNSLTGEVPGFLSQLEKLTVLNLTGNNLTGTVPEELVKKSKSGLLTLSVDPTLCLSETCEITTEKKETKKNNKSMVVPIVVTVAGVSALLLAFAIWWIFFLKKRKPKQQQPQRQYQQQQQQYQPQQVVSVISEASAGSNMMREVPFKAKQQQFTYSEVLMITRNFQRALGKGGFGTVYHGYIEDAQVAVKMLSPSSAQGYKQFKAEAELLMRVHHRNLTTLVGYCDEDDKLGLIYEYMANGDLETHLSDRNSKYLSWDLRLEIALDSAQGLEYLHTGCTPPIIHRDVKSTNILLSDEYQAKLADFGLSKAFPTEGSTHVSTTFAGTPGYFDPEFNLNEKSDIYSFGVVLLEIITGRPPMAKTKERTHLSQWVSRMLKTKGDVRDVVDPRLGKEFDVNSVWKAVDVAMECVSATSATRPTMNHVVVELKRSLAMEKNRTNNRGYQSESNYNSPEMSSLNIEVTGMSPLAR